MWRQWHPLRKSSLAVSEHWTETGQDGLLSAGFRGGTVASRFGGGTDAGTDVETDVGTDAGTDVETDVGTDAGTDVGTDAGTDVGTDVGTDAGTDVGTDAGTDAGTDELRLLSIFSLALFNFFK